jgi:aspartyl/asparaginyl beta-hydroxylase
MFIPTSDYPFLKKIQSHHKSIGDELQRAYSESSYVRNILNAGMGIDDHLKNWVLENGLHDTQTGYNVREGDHSALVIYKKNEAISEMDMKTLFPFISSLLEEIPGLIFSAISVLGPNSTLKDHAHTRKHYVYHLLLEKLIGGCCEIRCDNEKKELRNAGDEAMFDYSLKHGVTNYARNNRINLMIDFMPNK